MTIQHTPTLGLSDVASCDDLVSWLRSLGWHLSPVHVISVSDDWVFAAIGEPSDAWLLNPGDAVPLWIIRTDDPNPSSWHRVGHRLQRAYRGQSLVLFVVGGDGQLMGVSCLLDPDRKPATWRGSLSSLSSADRAVFDIFAERAMSTSIAAALDREIRKQGLCRRFFRDVEENLEAIAAGWTGIGETHHEVRRTLTIQLFCRLLFLYFVQRKGWLGGDPLFVQKLILHPRATRIYATNLEPLFFGALNRPEVERDDPRFEGVPFLNGGLFARSPAELDHPELDLPDHLLVHLIQRVFAPYRFIEDERSTEHEAIDPQMLGRVFEELMGSQRRSRTGAFYTPADLVHRCAQEAIQRALRAQLGDDVLERLLDGVVHRADAEQVIDGIDSLKVLDPAVGSGAFLLGALQLLAKWRALALRTLGWDCDAAEAASRRSIIADNLHGIDISATAVMLCELRLWLALATTLPDGADTAIEPLPNLGHKVRVGNALFSSLLIERASSQPTDPGLMVEHRRVFGELGRASGATKSRLEGELLALEVRIAEAGLERYRDSLRTGISELEHIEATPDLFGVPAKLSLAQSNALRAQREELASVDRELELVRSGTYRPGFEPRLHFASVFADGGFDCVVAIRHGFG